MLSKYEQQKMDKIEVSIIVSIYNVEPYLVRCIDSIINQIFRDIEIILVDDGSTDKCGKICDDYVGKDDRVKVIHKHNGGLSSARNAGLKLAKGRYVGFVDGDDYIAEDMYLELVKYMEDDVDITCCGRVYVYPKKETKAFALSRAAKFSSKEALEEVLLLRNMSWSACTKLFRRDLFDEIEFPVGRISEDVPTIYKLLKKARNIYHIGRAKYYNYYRNDSLSNKPFYLRRIDYLIFYRDICLDISQCYPCLLKQAEAGYVQAAIYIVENIKGSANRNCFRQIERRVRRLIWNMMLRCLLNPYLNNSIKREMIKVICEGCEG